MAVDSHATHVVGGEIMYTALGNNQYEITLKVYRDCGPTNLNGTGFDQSASIGVYYTASENYFTDFSIDLASADVDFVPIELENPCFILPPDVCVERAVYTEIVNLPATPGGYTLVYQRCCRNPSIVNLNIPEDQGATFTTHIPGTNETSENNSSAQFNNFPPVALCLNAEFFFDHSATDEDGDSLYYYFCSPLLGGTTFDPAPQPPFGPPFQEVYWATGFDASYPITSNPAFSIDPDNGFMTGTATELGQFVMGVCVNEYRDGVLINTSNRDFQFNVTICDPSIIASIPEQEDNCPGTEIVFENDSFNADNFFWDFGVEGIESDTSNLVSPSYTYSEQGQYVVTLVANPGWFCADTAQVTFNVFAPVNPEIVVDGYACVNGHDLYDFSLNGNLSPTTTYQWNFGSDSSPSSSLLAAPTGIMMNPEAAAMNVTLTVEDNGCTETTEESVNNPPDPSADIIEQSIFCNGLAYQFEQVSSNVDEYFWDFGVSNGGDQTNEASPLYVFPNPGAYEIMLVVSAPFTCSDTSYQEIEIFPEVNPSYPDHDVQCLTENAFDFEGIGAPTNAASYLWDFGPDAIPSSSTQANPQNVVFQTSGFHPVSLTITENGCTDTYIDSVQVVDHFLTTFDIVNAQGCQGLLAQFEGSAVSDVPVFYIWDFGDGTISSQGITSHVYEQAGVYDVRVTAFTTQGCQDSLHIVYPAAVIVHPNPQPGFIIQPQIVNINEPEVMVADSSFGSVSCNYIMSDGGSSDDCDFTYNWTQAGQQTITQYVTSEHGCVSSVSGIVLVEGFLLYAPNSFTPNEDGLNDFWRPEMTGVTSYHLEIYNRWGEKIFETFDPEMYWAGQVHDGEHYAPDGVYNFNIVAHDLLLQPHEFHGHISIIR